MRLNFTVFSSLALVSTSTVAWSQSVAGLVEGEKPTPFVDSFRSALWQEDVSSNLLYHNEGGGTRRLAFGASAASGNEYFVFQADVTGFFGLAVRSSQASAQPFYAYRAGPTKLANHWYSPSNSSWNLGIENQHALQVDSNRDLRVLQGVVHADGFHLNSSRVLYSQFASWDFLPNGYLGGFSVRLDLPQGAEIVQFQASIQSSGGTASAAILKVPDQWTSQPIVILGSVSATSNSTPSTLIGNGLVDNQNFSYHILVDHQPSVAPVTLVRTVRVQYRINEL